MEKLYLIDGYGFVFRAYHSLPTLTREDKTPIGCVYGFTNMLYRLLNGHNANYIAVVLDSGYKNFRHKLYDQYKANRPAVPQDLIVQFPIIREAIEAFNVSTLEHKGLEADDIIAYYANLAASKGIEVKIISSDKDLMQLINENIKLYDPLKGIDIGVEQVVTKLGVKPHQVVDYLSLVGDSSDNIPGVRGIGGVTAVKLIDQYGSLTNIYDNIDNVDKDRIKNMLIEGKNAAFLSYDLINLHRNYDLEDKLDELKFRTINYDKLESFLLVQGFKSLIAKIQSSKSLSMVDDIEVIEETFEVKFIAIQSINDIENIIFKIEKAGMIALHEDDKFIYFSFDNENYQIELSRQMSLLESNKLDYETIMISLRHILEATHVLKILHDAKSWYKKLLNLNVVLSSFEDVSLICYDLATGKHQYDLPTLLKTYLNTTDSPNSYLILHLFKTIKPMLVQEGVYSLYQNIDKKMIKVLAHMEVKGVRLDTNLLKNLSIDFQMKLDVLSDEIFNFTGKKFLISSPKQLGEILFDELRLTGGKKSKSGTYSTGVNVLEKLSDQGHSIADKILEWRQFSKLINTYTDALPNSVRNQRIHTTFNLTQTNTGRLSSQDPNLQNIPIRSEEGQKIRKAFIADEGKLIVSIDYSQIELRLLAHIANIKELKQAFIKHEDIHVITASQIFGLNLNEVDSHMRRQAKTINFGIIYGISGFGLAKRLGISKTQAQEYIDLYFKQYPGIKEYMDSTIAFAKKYGYVKTLMGRKCYINGINDRNFSIRNFSERAAINAPLQGSQADIIKKAMVRLPLTIQKDMILQIHDELLFEMKESDIDQHTKVIKSIMNGVIDLDVPLEVDIKRGKSWDIK